MPANRLADVLVPPPEDVGIGKAWLGMVSGDTVWRSLGDAVRRKAEVNWAELQARLDGWRRLITAHAGPEQTVPWWGVPRSAGSSRDLETGLVLPSTPRDVYELRLLEGMFSSARDIAEGRGPGQPYANIPNAARPDGQIWLDWLGGCARSLNPGLSVRHSESVPFLGAMGSGQGVHGYFTLEVIEGGSGRLFRDPADAFGTWCQIDFMRSMYTAWVWARRLSETQGLTEADVDGRWRIRWKEEEGIAGVDGESASGAALLGWYRTLRGEAFDPRILVVAAVTESDNEVGLTEVNFLGSKVASVRELSGAFDTILVAGKANRKDAREALGEDLERFQVIDLSGRLEA